MLASLPWTAPPAGHSRPPMCLFPGASLSRGPGRLLQALGFNLCSLIPDELHLSLSFMFTRVFLSNALILLLSCLAPTNLHLFFFVLQTFPPAAPNNGSALQESSISSPLLAPRSLIVHSVPLFQHHKSLIIVANCTINTVEGIICHNRSHSS